MTRRLYISPVAPFAFDRATIMRDAWSRARHQVQMARKPAWPFTPRATTLRAELVSALRRVWDIARSERCNAEFFAAQEAAAPAEAARRAALPVRNRQIEDARFDLMLAEHADTFTAAHTAAAASARARLHSLQHAA